MRRANTSPSSSEFEARRFAPCTPVHGDLTAGVEPGDARATPQVRAHAAGDVVLGRGHRDEVGHRIDAVGPAGLEDGGEALQPGVAAEHASVEPDVRGALLAHAPHDRLGHDVAGREVGERVLVGHEAHAAAVEENRPLAAHRLRDERLLPLGERAEPHDRRMELDELHVGDVRPGPERERHAVAGRHVGVRGLAEHLPEPARREDDDRCQGCADAVALPGAHHVQGDALGRPRRVAQQVEGEGVLHDLDARGRAERPPPGLARSRLRWHRRPRARCGRAGDRPHGSTRWRRSHRRRSSRRSR